MSFFVTLVPIVVTLTTFIVYVALGNTLTAASAFTALSLFQILRDMLLVVPMMITRVIDLTVVNRRLSRFLNAPGREEKQLDTEDATGVSGAPTPDGHFFTCASPRVGVPAVEIIEGAFRWPAMVHEKNSDKKNGGANTADAACGVKAGRFRFCTRKTTALFVSHCGVDIRPPTLSGVNISLPRGSLTVVIGPVGSGKTSLLHGVLGDMPRLHGCVILRGDVVYCAQEPWIQVTFAHRGWSITEPHQPLILSPPAQNMSLRDNILFGCPLHEALYTEVIVACALAPDLAQVSVYV